ncbi:hypothetical protein OAN96_00595 [Candidatus Gracilibacteria bacterium]|nr:hypothetical protein [Candidatus Gracilibacteria bacterium]
MNFQQDSESEFNEFLHDLSQGVNTEIAMLTTGEVSFLTRNWEKIEKKYTLRAINDVIDYISSKREEGKIKDAVSIAQFKVLLSSANRGLLITQQQEEIIQDTTNAVELNINSARDPRIEKWNIEVNERSHCQVSHALREKLNMNQDDIDELTQDDLKIIRECYYFGSFLDETITLSEEDSIFMNQVISAYLIAISGENLSFKEKQQEYQSILDSVVKSVNGPTLKEEILKTRDKIFTVFDKLFRFKPRQESKAI